MAKTAIKEYRDDIRARFLQAVQEIIASGVHGVASDSEFGEMVGIQQQNITKMRTGSRWPTLDQVCRLCDIFDYSMDWVMRGNGDKRAKPKKTVTEKNLEQINHKLDLLLANK